MVFATDSLENRKQRAVQGNLLRECGLIESGDWVLTLHVSGHLYRWVFESESCDTVANA